MLKEIKIRIDNQELLNKIEALGYEVESRKAVIAYLVEKDLTNSPGYEKYSSEYRDFFVQFEATKASVEAEIKSLIETQDNIKVQSWNLEYATGEITVTYNET